MLWKKGITDIEEKKKPNKSKEEKTIYIIPEESIEEFYELLDKTQIGVLDIFGDKTISHLAKYRMWSFIHGVVPESKHESAAYNINIETMLPTVTVTKIIKDE